MQIGKSSLSRYMVKPEGPPLQRGIKPLPRDFREEILSRLIFRHEGRTIASAIYDHATVRAAARHVAASPPWDEVERIQELRFSPGWIVDFLNANRISRRRIVTATKSRPPADEVHAWQHRISSQVGVHNGATRIPVRMVLSADETGIAYTTDHHYKYTSKDDNEACAASGDKRRFTAMLFAFGDGEMGIPFFIVKITSPKADLSNTRVLQAMFDKNPKDAGWTLESWSKIVKITNKSTTNHIKFTRPYLRHESGAIITVQHKAWMDTVAMVMWIELVLSPAVKKRDPTPFNNMLVWDNCGPHKTEAVLDTLAAHHIHVETLPPNMTDQLQVMDLVVNGPMKAALRNHRASHLGTHLAMFRAKYQAAVDVGGVPPKYDPPLNTLSEAITIMRKLHQKEFAAETFAASIRKSFVSVGVAPMDGAGNFQQWRAASSVETVYAAELVDTLDVQPMTDADRDDQTREEEAEYEYVSGDIVGI
jgi:hypothetical protein